MERFEHIRELGVGCYGRAFLVRKLEDQRSYVIKQMKLPYLMSALQDKQPAPIWDQSKLVELAYQEVELLTSLDHPNIVKAYEAFEDTSSNLNLVMEFCDCGDLSQAIFGQNGTFFPESQINSWFSQIVLAVKYLHDRKILHRDIKAANVFLVSDKKVAKLGDFGIAKRLDQTGAMAKTHIGTPVYLAPEICQGIEYGQKAEVWALGVLLYEMACLRYPFLENNIPALYNAIMTKSHDPVIQGQYSESLYRLVDKLLAKRANDRPSAGEILEDDFLPSTKTADADTKSVTSTMTSGVETLSLREDDNEMVEAMQAVGVEPFFKEPMLTIFREQMLTPSVLTSLDDDEVKSLCPNKKGLQLAMVRFVRKLRDQEKSESKSELKKAIEDGDSQKIRKIVQALDGEDLNEIKVDEETGDSPLHLACRVGSADVVKTLLALGCRTDVRNRFEDQPLHAAAFKGRLLAVDKLLKGVKDIDVNAVGQLGRTALHMAAASGYQNVVAMLVENGAAIDAVSSPEDAQQTALLIATYFGHLGTVRYLIDKGASMLEANIHGDSALQIATVQNKVEIVKLLLDKAGVGIGELLEKPGYRGRMPLHAAAAWGRPEITRVLLSKGANTRAPSSHQLECGDLALHLAAYYGQAEVVKVLLDGDCGLMELRNDNMETPLSRACFAGKLATARLLLYRGASTNARDKNNLTPLDYAQRKADQVATASGQEGKVTAVENPAAAIVQLINHQFRS